ncbi:hypothetical protein Lal_00015265 [Lupinus albus]|nr:hypothetical protein Lal_00015265 [Lupinus albus]
MYLAWRNLCQLEVFVGMILYLRFFLGYLALSIQQKWLSSKLSRGGPSLSHILFADDVLLFYKTLKARVRLNTKTMDKLCKSSSLKVNVDKSKYMCSRNVSTRRWNSFVNICSMRAVCNLGIYLGIPLFQGRVARSMLNPITEKIQRHMATWKSNIMNKADWKNMFLTLFLLTQCRLCGFLRSCAMTLME